MGAKPRRAPSSSRSQDRMGSKAVVDALPPPILALFQPRPPLPFLKPVAKGKCRPLDSMAQYVDLFEAKEETPPKPPPADTKGSERSKPDLLWQGTTSRGRLRRQTVVIWRR